MEDFDPYFASRRKLLPRHMDLSFYNWDTGFSTSNSTPNYQVHIKSVKYMYMSVAHTSLYILVWLLGQTNLITSFSGFQISKPMREAAFYFIF